MLERIPQSELDDLVARVSGTGKFKRPAQFTQEGRTAVISDIHSNYWALKAVFENISEVGVDQILCAGDVIGYGPRPNECCYLLQRLGGPTVMGNHEFGVLNQDYRNFDMYGNITVLWTASVLDKSSLTWLRSLYRSHGDHKKQLKMVHGYPEDKGDNPMSKIDVYLFPTDEIGKGKQDKEYIEKYLSNSGVNILVTGHTHKPYILPVNGKYAINPGSVGQPRDGDLRASYALIGDGEPRIIRVDYAVYETVWEIKKLFLPRYLADRLADGK